MLGTVNRQPIISGSTAQSKKNTGVMVVIHQNYDLNDAKNDNCVIFENSDITYGQTVWDDFISATKKGLSTTVRLVFYQQRL